MNPYNDDPHTQFGIDEIYIYKGFELNLLNKLQQRATLSLDPEETIVKNNVSHDMILIFHKHVPSKNLTYRFLEFLNQYSDKEFYIKSNTLDNEDELFEAVKLKKFFLVSHRMLSKETYCPETSKR